MGFIFLRLFFFAEGEFALGDLGGLELLEGAGEVGDVFEGAVGIDGGFEEAGVETVEGGFAIVVVGVGLFDGFVAEALGEALAFFGEVGVMREAEAFDALAGEFAAEAVGGGFGELERDISVVGGLFDMIDDDGSLVVGELIHALVFGGWRFRVYNFIRWVFGSG